MTDQPRKTALVTGPSRGIGRASARALARDGARVIIHYGRAKDEAESLRERPTQMNYPSSIQGGKLEAVIFAT